MGIVIKYSASMGMYRAAADRPPDRIMSRIWAKDYTVWKKDPTEISNRLGWLDSPFVMENRLREILDLTDRVRADGYNQALLLGMGGSSLAPEVFQKTFGTSPGYLDLAILDSTDPGAVLSWTRALDPAKTLFVVSTKSGGTVETFSFLKYFYNRTVDALGAEEAGKHFIAITDPGSGLAEKALKLRFRHIFYNDPDIGGRYSALSCFGLVPAALIGVDIGKLIERTAAAAAAEKSNSAADGMNAAILGTILGELAGMGRNKLTFFFSQKIESFGDWLEQLIAESTGKEGKGIVPIVGAPPGPPDVYGQDRVFVDIRLSGDPPTNNELDLLGKAGHPVIHMEMQDRYDLGSLCFLWELATAIAGAKLGINPFDQPDVESAKAFARQIVAQCQEQGRLPEETPDFDKGNVAVYGMIKGNKLQDILDYFLATGIPGDYVAIQAYLQPIPAVDEALQGLRLAIRNHCHLAVTLGYGPRFLHSTGQLHKGDAGQGLFLQITADDQEDTPIPDEAGKPSSSLTFGTLKAAQALGDRQALLKAGRRIMRLHIKANIVENLRALYEQ